MTRPAIVLLASVWLAVLGVSVALAAELSQAPAQTPAADPNVAPSPTPAPPAPTPTPQPANGPAPAEGQAEAAVPLTVTPIAWRSSRALGKPFAGRLVNGVELPEAGRDYFTWDPVKKRAPNRDWRRHGTDRLLRVVLRVLAEHRAAYPDAPRVGIGDLSRPQGGDFGPQYGSLGHGSHQNGLDVDVYYARVDGAERRPYRPDQVDQELAQDLVDRFVDAGAQYVFVGPRLSLTGPRKIVQKLAYHDDHLHLRLPAR